MGFANATISGDDVGGEAAPILNRPFLHARLRLLFLFLLLGYGIMCLLSIALLAYLRVHRRYAYAGDPHAARRVILPAFEPLLLVLAAATLVYSLYFATALATNLFAFKVSTITTEIFYSGRQFVFLSVVVFMLQPSVSQAALLKSMAMTLVLATYTIPIVAMLPYLTTSPYQFYVVHTASRALLLLLYAYVLIKPPPRASKQSLREFCVYASVYYALLFAYNASFYQHDPHTGFLLTYANLIWGSLCPLVIWRVLQADTEHWRRLGQRAVALQQNLSSSLSSSTASASSSSTASMIRRGNVLALEVTTASGSHVLIEMRRKFVIDFAYLDLQHAIARGRGRRASRAYDPVGDGDTAATRAPVVVYRGVLRGQCHVAVKVYTPPHLDEAIIAQFAHEAALCGALRHPNVVHFVGICVRPPTICMVTELCVANLETVIRLRQRPQLLVRLANLLDAARAVAYLHSFSPPFLHRDITPASFLVDANGTVKLTDFGDARSLPLYESPSMAMANDPLALPLPLPLALADLATPSPSASSFSLASAQSDSGHAWQPQLPTPSPLSPRTHRRRSHVMTIKGTVEYMAPELLRGHAGHAGHACYGEAADVFALAITMWDILCPTEQKYPLARENRFKVIETVLAGERPRLGDELPPTLRALLATAWDADARLRPQADHVVRVLESLQEELAAPLVQQLVGELATQKQLTKIQSQENEAVVREVVTGTAVVELLVANGYVDNKREALRMGNALLEASLAHHTTHTKPFEASEEETYYFDMGRVHTVGTARDPPPRTRRKLSRSALASGSPSPSPLLASSLSLTSGSLLAQQPPPFHPDRTRRVEIPSSRPKPLPRRSPSAPALLPRRGRRRYESNQVPYDTAELFCACRELSQRLPPRASAAPPRARRFLQSPEDPAAPELRKVKSSPVFSPSRLAIAHGVDHETLESDRTMDWESFVLAIEASDDEAEEKTG